MGKEKEGYRKRRVGEGEKKQRDDGEMGLLLPELVEARFFCNSPIPAQHGRHRNGRRLHSPPKRRRRHLHLNPRPLQQLHARGPPPPLRSHRRHGSGAQRREPPFDSRRLVGLHVFFSRRALLPARASRSRDRRPPHNSLHYLSESVARNSREEVRVPIGALGLCSAVFVFDGGRRPLGIEMHIASAHHQMPCQLV
ncbi:Hypothetical predicted protein [Prunus dulcis]|uniref:Uncharacterized protein n=1 Tax=Prunus dulcis TaxID=3755 RepID=A0A5E4FY63_PRUDU|nr:Hypothetical predicted protein [Prunus dulcis]